MSSDESSDTDNEMSGHRRPLFRLRGSARRRRERDAENAASEERRATRHQDLERRRLGQAENGDSGDRNCASPFHITPAQPDTLTSPLENMASLLTQLSVLIQEATETLVTQHHSSEPEQLLYRILDLNPRDPNVEGARSEEASTSRHSAKALLEAQGSQPDFTSFALAIIFLLMLTRWKQEVNSHMCINCRAFKKTMK